MLGCGDLRANEVKLTQGMFMNTQHILRIGEECVLIDKPSHVLSYLQLNRKCPFIDLVY